MKFFGAVRQKSLKEKCDTCSIPTCPQFSSTQEVLWNAEGFPLRRFSVLGDKKKSTEDRDITHFIIKVFDTRSLWNTKGFPCNNFRQYETLNFQWKNLYTPCPSPLLSINFSANRNFLQHSTEWLPYEFLR